MFSEVAEISTTSENTGDIYPSFYNDRLRLLDTNNIKGKITEFLKA